MKTVDIKITYTLLILMSLAFSSCSDDILNEIDTNPNSPIDVPINQLLPRVTMEAVYGITGGHTAMGISTYVEHTTNVHLERLDPDIVEANIWSNSYSALNDLKVMLEKADSQNSVHYSGIGKILYVYIVSVNTDVYGDMPLSEALSGSLIRDPEFDPQEDIYNHMFDMLESAIEDLSQDSNVNPGNADLIFAGDIGLWKKMAYGLQARLWNRLSEVVPQQSAENALKAVPLSFDENEAFVFDKYQDGTVNDNPWTGQQKAQQNHAVSQTVLDVMNQYTVEPSSDPRMELWFTKIGDQFIGAPADNAITDPAHTIFSAPSRQNVLYDKAPQPILNYSELKFIEAEANLRLGNPEEANNAYEDAVLHALMNAGLSEQEILEYVNQGLVFPGEGNLSLKNIMEQKWLSFWMFQSLEAYNDVRRTGYPSMKSNRFPLRIPYPDSERSRNPNTPSNININTIYSIPVWWDQ